MVLSALMAQGDENTTKQVSHSVAILAQFALQGLPAQARELTLEARPPISCSRFRSEQSSMAVMEDALATVLRSAGVAKEINTHLVSISCNTLVKFAHWADTKAECAKYLVGSQWEKDPAELALIKHAWRQANTEVDLQLKRRAEGYADEAFIEEPLRAEQQDAMMTTYFTKYFIKTLSPKRIISDGLLARIKREFERWAPTLLPVLSVKTQADSRKNPVKHRRLSEGMVLTVGAGPSEEDGDATLFIWCEKFRVNAGGWTIAGCYDVNEQADSTTRRLMVHQDEAHAYIYEFFDLVPSLQIKFSDLSIMKYFDAVHMHFMANTIEVCRGPKRIPFGKGLTDSVQAKSAAWQTEQGLLQPRHVRKENPPPPPQRYFDTGAGTGNQNGRSPRDGKDGKGKGKDKSKKGRMKTCRFTANQEPICLPWNDARGCNKTSCQKHVCDAMLLETGKACAKNHRRIDHNPATHGAVKTH